jgi:hypothetical protein
LFPQHLLVILSRILNISSVSDLLPDPLSKKRLVRR